MVSAALTAFAVLALASPAAASGTSDADPAARAAVIAAFAANPVRPAADASRTVSVFLTPHQDDETLSMGTPLEQAVATGRDVWLVEYTDGSRDAVCGGTDGTCTSDDDWNGRTVASFVDARDREQEAAALALGVAADHVSRDPFRDGRARMPDQGATAAGTALVLARWHAAYPDAQFWAMSWVDTHPDHAAMGEALRAAVAAGLLRPAQARFVMFAPYYHFNIAPAVGFATGAVQRSDTLRVLRGGPAAPVLVRCLEAQCRMRITTALDAYEEPYGIGFASVRRQFLAATANADHTVVVHDARTLRYAASTSTTLVRRSSHSVALTGRCTIGNRTWVLGSGVIPGQYDALAYGTSVRSTNVVGVYATGYVSVTFTDRGGRIRSLRVAVTTDGSFATTFSPRHGRVVTSRCVGVAHTDASTSVRTAP